MLMTGSRRNDELLANFLQLEDEEVVLADVSIVGSVGGESGGGMRSGAVCEKMKQVRIWDLFRGKLLRDLFLLHLVTDHYGDSESPSAQQDCSQMADAKGGALLQVGDLTTQHPWKEWKDHPFTDTDNGASLEHQQAQDSRWQWFEITPMRNWLRRALGPNLSLSLLLGLTTSVPAGLLSSYLGTHLPQPLD
ncbi:hypothetical protein GGX14DRAFT_578289 [Mycena pura]|uniref:Uncharacterized protein n=1 Tax=Mycena pura TaxID=153505 RepID=A0AAD6UTZ3_9AGAR|nr:hypothetical protein GGX14DRAFT_578289 [Mycena pura]